MWSVDTSIRVLNRLAGYDLEFCEDPTWGVEGMARVRERTLICSSGWVRIDNRDRDWSKVFGEVHPAVAMVGGTVRFDEPMAAVVGDVFRHGFVGVEPNLGTTVLACAGLGEVQQLRADASALRIR